ncbi:MAG: hypothetical protein S0880_18545 [Actinomycetota bacterium]|nr:hypothetical protein [Actinomycetota bacterium]
MVDILPRGCDSEPATAFERLFVRSHEQAFEVNGRVHGRHGPHRHDRDPPLVEQVFVR